MIRLLTPSDAPAFKALRLLSLKTDPIAFLSSLERELTFLDSYFVSQITFAAQAPIFGIYGFWENTTLVGIIQLAAEYHVKNRHLANIYMLYVHPDYRKQGIARKLLEHLISQAKTLPELEQLHLRVNSRNLQAINLYKKLGFTLLATRPQAVKEPDGTYQDELLFYLKLK